MDFVAIDFETANQSRNSACALGLAYVNEGKITGRSSLLIRPPDKHFAPVCTAVHGLTWNDVKDASDFPEIWERISDRLSGSVIIAYNAGFDMSVLRACLSHYNIPFPKLHYACALVTSRRVWPDRESHKLESLCIDLGIEPGGHEAGNDARACAQVMLAAAAASGNMELHEFLGKHKVPIKQLASCEWSDTPSYGKQEIDRSVNIMDGIVRGIIIDGKVNKAEKHALVNWYHEHRELADRYPLKDIVTLIDTALEDGIIDLEEIEGIEWLISKIQHEYFSIATTDIQKLYGILFGILSDKELLLEEVAGLHRWIKENEHLRDCYPYDLVSKIADAVLADGKLDDEEKQMAKDVFEKILSESGTIRLSTPSTIALQALDETTPSNPSVATLPWSSDPVVFAGSTFVISGESEFGTRSELESRIISQGGMVSSAVNKKTSYLVIGGQGNQAWAFSTYGKKIETALSLISSGKNIKFLKDTIFR